MKTRQMHLIARAAGLATVVGASAALLACTTIGTGSGSLSPGNTPVTFNWTSQDGGNSGTMTATLAGGGTFNGPFLQVTSSVRMEAFEPIWRGWRRGWSDWGYWGYGGYGGAFPDSAFTTRYSGKVVANLQGDNSQRLRCRFHLNDPATGMRGGGQGECQYDGGRTVEAVFPGSVG